MRIEGRDVIPIPIAYWDEFRRDPVDALIKFGSAPQRSRAPWFTNVETIERSLVLPDVVSGAASVTPTPTLDYKALEGSPDEFHLLNGISPHFQSTDDSMWHIHVDLALNKKRHGDAAGIAMGRVAGQWAERARDPLQKTYERIVRIYEIPLVAQIVAPSGDQIYIGSITRLILQLKQLRGFNITSFSFDGFQSADAMQQLALAGLVTHGMNIEHDGSVTGMPKPFSVDGHSDMPYREVLEAANEDRLRLPKYALLGKEFRGLEVVAPGLAPDHPYGAGGSKDVADPVAGICGYLAAYGHAVIGDPNAGRVFSREDLGLPEVDAEDSFDVEENIDWGETSFDPVDDGAVSFGVE